MGLSAHRRRHFDGGALLSEAVGINEMDVVEQGNVVPVGELSDEPRHAKSEAATEGIVDETEVNRGADGQVQRGESGASSSPVRRLAIRVRRHDTRENVLDPDIGNQINANGIPASFSPNPTVTP
jgi:hypothetical protein